MATSRNSMMNWLEKKGINVCGTAEHFYGTEEDKDGGIWMSGEEGDGFFDYYNQSSKYDFGVLITLSKQVEKKGWYFEWNDPGTIMAYKI
jgi:hypothetical protein